MKQRSPQSADRQEEKVVAVTCENDEVEVGVQQHIAFIGNFKVMRTYDVICRCVIFS